jgi:hypothetical protein
MIKGKFMTSTEKLTQSDAETKANRETIQRLVNEMNKFEKDSVSTKVLVDTLKAVSAVQVSLVKFIILLFF